jgi:hypothetical protein
MKILPVYILLEIIGENIDAYRKLVLALPRLGRFSLKSQAQIQDTFTVRSVGLYGRVVYTLNGSIHRRDGPAISDGVREEWLMHGVKTRPGNLPAFYTKSRNSEERINSLESGNDRRERINSLESGNDQRERIKTPTLFMGELYDYMEWWVDGELHREDGPAVVFANGERMWYKHGRLHREDGPAVEKRMGWDVKDRWYENGIKIKPKNLRDERVG